MNILLKLIACLAVLLLISCLVYAIALVPRTTEPPHPHPAANASPDDWGDLKRPTPLLPGYEFHWEGREISGPGTRIPGGVFAFRFDENFIVAKVHPSLRDEKEVQFWIVDVKNGEQEGPMTEAQYSEARTRLKIPDSLKIHGVY